MTESPERRLRVDNGSVDFLGNPIAIAEGLGVPVSAVRSELLNDKRRVERFFQEAGTVRRLRADKNTERPRFEQGRR